MPNQIIEVEAESLKAARAEVKSKLPAGQVVLNERVISDGKPQTVRRHADTLDEALKLARQAVPADGRVIDERDSTEAQMKTQTVEVSTEGEIPAEVKRHFGATAVIKAKKLITPPKKGFMGIGKKPAVHEVEVFLPALASVTWTRPAKIAAEIGKEPERKHAFAPFVGSGICDVCNGTLTPGKAYMVPVNTFYNSSKYRNFLRNDPLLRALGGGMSVEMHIANMRAMDKTTHSAVCEKCIHMFE